jgi:hypothetical protein
MAALRAELKEQMGTLSQNVEELRHELRAEFRTEIHSLRADMIRWMFGFWITTVLTLAGLMVALRGT